MAAEDIKVFDHCGMLKNWMEGPTLGREDELYDIMLIHVREKTNRASMRTAFVTAPKFQLEQAEGFEKTYIENFRKTVLELVTDEDWITARELEEGRPAPDKARLKELRAANKKKLSDAMRTVTCHAVFPFSHASLCQQKFADLLKAQESAQKEYEPASTQTLPVRQVIRHCGMERLYVQIKEALRVKPDVQKLLGTIRVHREALEKRIKMTAMEDKKKGRKGTREVRNLAEFGTEARHQVYIKQEFEEWALQVEELHGEFMQALMDKVPSAKGKGHPSTSEFEKRYEEFKKRYTQCPQSKLIPINFFVGTDTATPTAKHAGPKHLISTFFSDNDFAAHVVAKLWTEHIGKVRQLLKNKLLPSIGTKVVTSLKQRFVESGNGIYDEISKLILASIEEAVEASFVEPYDSSLPIQGKKAVPTGIREPLFRAARRIFEDTNGAFKTFSNKKDVLAEVWDGSKDVAQYMVEELFEWRKRGISSRSCLSNITVGVYKKAQVEADKLFSSKAKELGKEIDEGFLKAVVTALATFEDDIRHMEHLSDQIMYSEDLVSEALKSLNALETNIEQDEVVNEELLAKIRTVVDNSGCADLRQDYMPDSRSRLYNPAGDGHCLFRALAAARSVRVSVSVCEYVNTCVSLLVYVYVHVHVCVYICLHVCTFMCVCQRMCMNMSIHMSGCTHQVYVYVGMCLRKCHSGSKKVCATYG